MHNVLDDKHPTRLGFEPSMPASEFRATTGPNEPSGPVSPNIKHPHILGIPDKSKKSRDCVGMRRE